MKIRLVGADLFHAGEGMSGGSTERTDENNDMTQLTFDYRNFYKRT